MLKPVPYQPRIFSSIRLVVPFLGIVLINSASADVSYTDIAGPETGITYERTPSQREEVWENLRTNILFPSDWVLVPAKSRGAPGVAILDYDMDGDLDLYVTNGPGTPNSLYSNQLKEIGEISFIDVAILAGVDATLQDSNGVCFGDLDNDNDPDLVVLGYEDGNRLFINQGNGTFDDRTENTPFAIAGLHPSSCTMGDINGDGLLDVAVANTFDDWDHKLPIGELGFVDLNEQTQLFVNLGDNLFEEIGESSGIHTNPGVTWTIAFVDYDLDGDVDLITGDDQGPKPPAQFGGSNEEGLLRLFENDGTGQFTEQTQTKLGLDQYGAWMGLTFGDYNRDGHMDFFGTNAGDYLGILSGIAFDITFQAMLGDYPSIWFTGGPNGFTRQEAGPDLVATPFGWGAETADYDNDGDLDIIYHGGLQNGPFGYEASNPGTVLNNDGNANFSADLFALANSTDHTRRTVEGVAVADLDQNGIVDIVSVSSDNFPANIPLVPFPSAPLGGPYDSASIWPTFAPVNSTDPSQGFAWTGIETENGTLSVELGTGNPTNGWARVRTIGSVGLLENAVVNRDGIGAVVKFTPHNSPGTMLPVLGGASYASQGSLELEFGLGNQLGGTVDILWPGGVRNRLYNVYSTENVIIPEIPCSYDSELSFFQYTACVQGSLTQLHQEGVIDFFHTLRLYVSALVAYFDG